MTKAYSYLRFSTPEQMRGDSYRRQMDLAREYTARHNLTLDDQLTFKDLGVSAFRGTNARTGALGAFLRAIDDDLVGEGSILLVESLDRISRQDPWDALPVFQQIINEGITIVTLQDGKEYSREEMRENPLKILESLFVMIRANEESVTKARRVRAAWSSKRKRATERPLTSICPAWIRRNGDTFELIPKHAGVVRSIYDMYLSGVGQYNITKELHKRRVAPFGKTNRWHRSYIDKILGNPAAVGTLVPHRVDHVDGTKKRIPLDPIPNYYPAAVDQEAFDRVQAMRQHGSARGRHAQAQIRSILASLAKCTACGAAMTRASKRKDSKGATLICTGAKTGTGCPYTPVSYEAVEKAIVSAADYIVDQVPLGGAIEGLDDELEAVDTGIGALEDGLEHLLDSVQAGEGTKSLMDRVRELEPELAELYDRQQELLGRKKEAQSPMVTKRLEDLRAALKADPLDRGAVNRLMRQVATAVTVSWYEGELIIRWRHGGETALQFAWPNIEEQTS